MRTHSTKTRLTLGSIAALFMGLACEPAAPPKAPDAVAQRAAFDLGCPADQLSFVPLAQTSPRSYGVTGCHKKVAYVEICSIAMYGMITNKSCQWTMDGAIQKDADVPPPVLPSTAPPPSASASEPTAN